MRYNALDAWRGYMALVIAASRLHLDSVLPQAAVIRNASPLVDFFFVLSGFVITYAYLGRIDGTMERSAGFVIRRVGRLWPLHAFTLAVLIGLEATRLVLVSQGVSSQVAPFTAEQSPSTIIANLFLLQAMGLYDFATWNTPAWSISVEFWTYMLFLLVVLFARRLLVVVSAGAIAVSLAVIGTRAPHGMESTFDYGFWRCVAGFFAGHLVFRLHVALRDRLGGGRLAWSAAEIALVAGVVAYLWLVPAESRLALATPFLMALAVFVFALERGVVSGLLDNALGRRMGAWSYSIYLVCPLVVVVVERGATLLERRIGRPLWNAPFGETENRLLTLGAAWANELLMLGYLALVVAAAAATYRFVEVPVRRLFYAWADRVEARRTRKAPAAWPAARAAGEG